jgi:hypothetical protein
MKHGKNGLTRSNLVHFHICTSFVTYQHLLSDRNPPTRATGESKLANEQFLVEIIITAALPTTATKTCSGKEGRCRRKWYIAAAAAGIATAATAIGFFVGRRSVATK